MEDLERLVAERLRALDDAAPSPQASPALLARIGHQVRARRRRRRITQSAAGLSLAVAAAVVAPQLLDSGEPSPTDPPMAAAPGSAAPDSPQRHASSPPRPGAAGGLPRDLPSGNVLHAFGITSDGAILGTGVGPRGRSDGVLWRADVSGLLTVPTPVAELDDLYAASGSRNMTIWVQRGEGGGYRLMCRSGESGPVRLGSGEVARRGAAAFHTDRGVAVWTDKADGTVWTAHGCDGEPAPLVKGHVVGFAHPYAYVLSTDGKGRPNGELQRVQIETGAREIRRLPRRHLGRDVLYAAGADTFSVASGRTLTVYDTGTWQPHRVPEKLPRGENGSLTAGDDLVAYAAHRSGDDRSLIYETKSGRVRMIDGEAYAKREWLLTREGETYRLTSAP